MITFDFSDQAVSIVRREINAASRFIYIAMFQMHDERVFELLNKKLNEKVKVEIFTLPYDSIHQDLRERVTNEYKKLEKNGARLYFNPWNIGDPARTTMAIGRWYSYHGKFIVTESKAIILSANMLDECEVDAVILTDDKEKIHEFTEKFNYLIDTFVTERSDFCGSIRQTIIGQTGSDDIKKIFKVPDNIADVHKRHWITSYPAEMCKEDVDLHDRLYIVPFDIRARNFYEKVLQNAQEFVYISSESFTDLDIFQVLKRVKINHDIDIHILTSGRSADFNDRIQKMYLELLAADIKIRVLEQPLHAKLIVTDQYVAVSSINLNKINLGFNETRRLWRGNTETLFLCSERDVIRDARNKYMRIFDQADDVDVIFSRRLQDKQVGNLFSHIYGLKTRKDAKLLLSKFAIQGIIKTEQTLLELGRITIKLKRLIHNDQYMVSKKDLLSALILYYLADHKHTYHQLSQKLVEMDPQVNADPLLDELLKYNLVEFTDDYYKIKLEKLLG